MAFPAPQPAVASNDFFLGGLNFSAGEDRIGATLLVQVRPDGSVRDHFRIKIHGDLNMGIYFPAPLLFDRPEAKNVWLYIAGKPDDIEIPVDRSASDFIDVQGALQDRSLDTVDSLGEHIPAEEFRKILFNTGNVKNAVGASYRYGVTFTSSGEPHLQVQGLPIPAKFLKANHHVDNVPTICLTWTSLDMFMGDNSPYQGPVPMMFSTEPKAAAAAIAANHERARDEMHKVTGRLLIMENVTLPQAKDYLAKYRPALGTYPFDNRAPRPSGSGQGKRTAKKPRIFLTPSGATEDTGG